MKTAQPRPNSYSGIRGVAHSLTITFALVLTACADNSDSPSQVIARVNDGEITVHQVNHLLQRTPNITQDNAEVAKGAIVKRLIEQEVLVQQAQEQKLDRDPTVLMELEAARRGVLARAYLRRVASRGPKPTDAELDQYFLDNPDLFSKRRVYQFSEVRLDKTPANWKDLQPGIKQADTLREAVDVLRAHGINPAVSHNVIRPGEKLPLHLLSKFATHKVGDLIVYRLDKSLVIGQIAGIKEAPVEPGKASEPIRQFLLAKRRTELIKAEAARLKNAATITYQRGFESLAGESTGSPQATATAVGSDGVSAQETGVHNKDATAKKAGSGLDSDSLTRGLEGLK